MWTWTLSVRSVADDQDRVAELAQERLEGRAVEVVALDDEVDAVPEAAVGVLGSGEAGRCLRRDVDLGRLLATEPGDDAGEDQHQAVRAGVDDPRLGEHVELIGGPLDRLLAGSGDHLEDGGEDLILLLLAEVRSRGSRRCRRERARCMVAELAIARTTVSIVPSAGLRTDS